MTKQGQIYHPGYRLKTSIPDGFTKKKQRILDYIPFHLKTEKRSLITVSTIKSEDEVGQTELISTIASLKLQGYTNFSDIETKFLDKKTYMIEAVKKDTNIEMVMYSFRDEGFLVNIVTFSSKKNMSNKTELESLYLIIRTRS